MPHVLKYRQLALYSSPNLSEIFNLYTFPPLFIPVQCIAV